MSEIQRRAYLEAMGIDVWLSRTGAGPDAVRLAVAEGEGSVLLIADSESACAGKLAGDIQRALGADAVWAWPVTGGQAGGEGLEDAIRRRLFTRVVVFGEKLATQLFGAEPPVALLSSAVAASVRLDQLAIDGAAKRELWQTIRGHDSAVGRPLAT